ncbi:Zinc/iron permease [Tothia fuscella]|uniref:Zinc/iron permease n=1 Tax=Tothia fuscella TaxID=1048955 RepID=A0A9P4P1A1_9PEZI|nr:Zinc/iron permease [Tothia fuscella]
MPFQGDVLLARDSSPWIDTPTALLREQLYQLREELSKRQDGSVTPEKPKCGSKSRGSYNTPIHVGALILILALSTIACAFPIIARRFPRLPIPHNVIFISRHFGTGVLIATAFVHLFPTAYISLTDPCLPYFWNTRYPAMPGLIAMVSVLTVVGIEMFFAMRGAGHVHGTAFEFGPGEHEGSKGNQRGGGVKRFRDGNTRPPAIQLEQLQGSSENLMAGRSPSLGQPSPLPPSFVSNRRKSADLDDSDSDNGLDLNELTEEPDTGLLNGTTKRSEHQDDSDETVIHHDIHEPTTTSEQAAHQKALLQCLLLEAGILFHSIFIGMALSVSTGPPFAVLLVAISFHQTFEGLALGARIGALNFGPSSPKPWLMALAYGTTTPIGQAIGLAIHNLYDPQSATGLLTVGIMNAISSGLLLFAGMVELLAEDFLSDQSYKTLRGKRRYQACGSVVAGALLMALVGAWA